MDYEKKYKDALSHAKQAYGTGAYDDSTLEAIFPELAESEDERIRRELISQVEKSRHHPADKARWISWLEKQKEKEKYDRMQPVYDNLDSFESALAKAWKAYNDSGSRTVDGCEDDYVECAHAKGFREGYLFGLEKQKELPFVKDVVLGYPGHYFYDGERMHFCGPVMEEKQEEQKPAESRKRNKPKESWLSRAKYEIEHADELLIQRQEELKEIRELKQKEQESESCEPDTNVEKIIEDVIRVYGKTQGEWVGGYDVDALIVNLRRAFNKQEQHPSSKYLPGDCVVYDGPLGHAILQIKDVIDGRYTFVDNDSTLLVEDSDKFLHPLTPKDVEKPAEWSDTDNIGWDEAFACVTRAEKSAKNEEELQNAVTAEKWLKEIKFKYYVHPVKQEWSKEDEGMLTELLLTIEPSDNYDEMRNWLLLKLKSLLLQGGKDSLQTHWKPSEEQMSMLLAVINDPNNAGAESCYMALKSIYNNLKKL